MKVRKYSFFSNAASVTGCCGLLCIWLFALSACVKHGEAQDDKCNDPDADVNCCFVNMPARLTHVMKLAEDDEKGKRLFISGTVYKADGKIPYPNVILYAYQTDHTGHYSKNGNEKGIQKWHGRLHGWCRTDTAGKYEIHTVRPAPYPGNSIPAHIHAVVKEPGGKKPSYIKDFVFADDSLVNELYLSREYGKGASGVVELKKLNDETWRGTRDLIITDN